MSLGEPPAVTPCSRSPMYGDTATTLPVSILFNWLLGNLLTPLPLRYVAKTLLSNEGMSSSAKIERPPFATVFIITSSFLYSVGFTITCIPLANVHTVVPNSPASSFLTFEPLRVEGSIKGSFDTSAFGASISAVFTAARTAFNSASVGTANPSFSGAV